MMLQISVCMIGKNEEKNIRKCLESLTPYFSDIIYVDTGSTDRTIEIVSQYLSHIHYYQWSDDFSAARNYSISLAINNWILIIDCDEYLLNIDTENILRFINNNPTETGKICRHNYYQLQNQEYTMTEQLDRLFPKKYYNYTGIIHEQLTLTTDIAANSFEIPIEIGHSGYAGSVSELVTKAKRNIRLLKNCLNTDNMDPYILFQLGQSYFMIEDYKNAAYYFQKGFLLDLDPSEQYVQMMVESYGYSLLYQKEYNEALQLLNLYDYFCQKADFIFLIGLIYMNNAMFDNAIAEFNKAATLNYCSVEGVNSFLSFYNIGVIYECLGITNEAINYYKKCGSYQMAAARLYLLEKKS